MCKSNRFVGIAIVLASLVSQVAMAQTVITKTPTADADVQTASSVNHGTVATMTVKGGLASATSNKGYIKFDVTIPANSGVSQATLKLWAMSTSQGDSTFGIFRANKDWTETGIKKANYDATHLWDNTGGDWTDANGVAQGTTPYATVPVHAYSAKSPATGEQVQLDVTSLVRAWTSGQVANQGLVVMTTNTTGSFTVATKENGTTTWWPQLEITVVQYTQPDPPTGLAASNVGPYKLDLSWTAPHANPTGSVMGYDIRYSTSTINDGNWDSATQVTGEPAGATPGTQQTMTITGLNPSTDYYFAAKAIDPVGQLSALSNVATAHTGTPDTIPPSAITNLAGAVVDDHKITLTWTAPSDTGGSGMGSYDVRYSTAQIFDDTTWAAATQVTGVPAPKAAGSTETLTVTGLTADTLYYFAIKSADNGTPPNVSALSNIPTARTLVTDIWGPNAVTDLSATATTLTSVTVTWTAPSDVSWTGVLSYDLRYSTSPIADDSSWTNATQVSGEPTPGTPGAAQTKTITGLTAGVTYYYAIKSSDKATPANVSALSNVFSLAQPTDTSPPAAIADLSAWLQYPDKVKLAWTAPADSGTWQTGTGSYEVRYSTSQITDDATFAAATLVAGVPAPKAAGLAETLTVTGLQLNTTYYFAIKTSDKATPPNVSALSNVRSAKTATAVDVWAPNAITDLAAGASGGTSVTLTWTVPADVGEAGLASYDIRYSTTIISDDTSFAAATAVATPPTPVATGTTQTFSVSGLSSATQYYFAIKCKDAATPANVSAMSNVVSGRTRTPVSPVTVHNPWLANDRVADTHTLASMAATFDKQYTPQGVIAPDKSDIETRIINEYNNFKRRWYHWGQMPANKDDAVSNLNVFGWALCGTQASLNSAIVTAMGLHSRTICIDGGGHTFWEVEYPAGSGKWHAFDTMTTYYVWSRTNPRYVVSQLEVKADHSLVLNAAAEGRACPGFLLCGDTPDYFATGSDSFSIKGDPGAGAVTKSMNFDLRVGESLKRTWESWGGQYYNYPTNTPPYHHEAANDYKDYVNIPYWEPYQLNAAQNTAAGITYSPTYRRWSNGTYTLAPDFQSAAYQSSVVSKTNIATFNDDGLSPDVHPAATGSLATIVFTIATPFYLTDLNIAGTFVKTSATDINRVWVSGTSATAGFVKIWDNADTGTTQLTALNARTQVFGKYALWVKIELQATTSKTDAGVSGLVITPIFEHNKGSLAYLDRGVNNITLTFDNPDELQASHNLMHIVYKWKEYSSSTQDWTVDKQFETYAISSPATFTITTGGNQKKSKLDNQYYDTVPRTEYILMEVVPSVDDSIAPNAVVDLQTSSLSPSRIQLKWTAPADYDSNGGPNPCVGYDIRSSTTPFPTNGSAAEKDAWFAAATKATGIPGAVPPGTMQTCWVNGLRANTTYWFAMKAIDKGYNSSLLSNAVTATTPDQPYIDTLDVVDSGITSSKVPLTWIAIDDGSTGQMASYDLRRSTAPLADTDSDTQKDAWWAAATLVTSLPTPKTAGSTENFAVTFLNPETTYYFAIKTKDAASNISRISNIVSATTTVAPVITDLNADAVMPFKVMLSWTAIDDGSTGTYASYDFRYSTSPISDDASFTTATAATGEPAPKAAGSDEAWTLQGLTPSTTYWVAMKAVDAGGHSSPLSNVVTFTTPAPDLTAPNWIGDLKGQPSHTPKGVDLTWTAPADYGANGTGPFACAVYDVRYSASPITEANFASATAVAGVPAPKAPGQAESLTVTLPAGGQTYYFAIKVADEGVPPNVSEISNCAAGKTSVFGDKVLQNGLNGYTGCLDSYFYLPSAKSPTSTKMTVCGWGGTDWQHAILKFDVTSILGLNITSATLSLYAYDDASRTKGNSGLYGAYAVTRDWDVAAVDPNNAKSGVPWTTQGGDYVSPPDGTVAKRQGGNYWYNFDVTNRVQCWLNNSCLNYGWIIRLTDENVQTQDCFYSSDYSTNTTLRPKLVVSDVPVRKIGDINGDGYVNVNDLILMVNSWAKNSSIRGFEPWADLNNDGYVNVGDLQVLIAQWGN